MAPLIRIIFGVIGFLTLLFGLWYSDVPMIGGGVASMALAILIDWSDD